MCKREIEKEVEKDREIGQGNLIHKEGSDSLKTALETRVT